MFKWNPYRRHGQRLAASDISFVIVYITCFFYRWKSKRTILMAEHMLSGFSSVPVFIQRSDDEVLLNHDEVTVSLPNDREFFTTLRHYVQRKNHVLDALLEDSKFTRYNRD